ncbi:MAG TPA: hypothetical protein VNO17_08550 [Actinomycetota bacterium]|nr:hypothetical protein [Actinomycetota bacterium]
MSELAEARDPRLRFRRQPDGAWEARLGAGRIVVWWDEGGEVPGPVVTWFIDGEPLDQDVPDSAEEIAGSVAYAVRALERLQAA